MPLPGLPPYLLRLRDRLRSDEPGRWEWFASDRWAEDYAAALSRGDEVDARAALRSVSRAVDQETVSETGDATATALANALRGRGWRVTERVGGSRFRCELAVGSTDDSSHRLAVLVDTDAHYESGDPERAVSRKALAARCIRLARRNRPREGLARQSR